MAQTKFLYILCDYDLEQIKKSKGKHSVPNPTWWHQNLMPDTNILKMNGNNDHTHKKWETNGKFSKDI